MIDQGYDGASFVSGKKKAFKCFFLPGHVYLNMSTYLKPALNLILVKSCAIFEIHSTFDFIEDNVS